MVMAFLPQAVNTRTANPIFLRQTPAGELLIVLGDVVWKAKREGANRQDTIPQSISMQLPAPRSDLHLALQYRPGDNLTNLPASVQAAAATVGSHHQNLIEYCNMMERRLERMMTESVCDLGLPRLLPIASFRLEITFARWHTGSRASIGRSALDIATSLVGKALPYIWQSSNFRAWIRLVTYTGPIPNYIDDSYLLPSLPPEQLLSRLSTPCRINVTGVLPLKELAKTIKFCCSPRVPSGQAAAVRYYYESWLPGKLGGDPLGEVELSTPMARQGSFNPADYSLSMEMEMEQANLVAAEFGSVTHEFCFKPMGMLGLETFTELGL
ncbi:hypothetical protein EV356DRAFT_573922 [Viridothelium virens]|uniref:Uncharacterized protein n=1 Tax=Viridothelium virens TaxID=1048519 RepID=A0A6A6HIZ0_VIRVR|nr:hypothetical protein EV356DRAFT_573922 [Viridothelium virens]